MPTVVALVGRMQAQGLIVARGQDFDLTPDGERLALQVVRAHRLLERYFADEARLPLARRARRRRAQGTLTLARGRRSAVGVARPSDARSARRSDSDARRRGRAGVGHAGDVVAGRHDRAHRPSRGRTGDFVRADRGGGPARRPVRARHRIRRPNRIVADRRRKRIPAGAGSCRQRLSRGRRRVAGHDRVVRLVGSRRTTSAPKSSASTTRARASAAAG